MIDICSPLHQQLYYTVDVQYIMTSSTIFTLTYLTELFMQTLSGKEEWCAAWVVLNIDVGTIFQQVEGNVL